MYVGIDLSLTGTGLVVLRDDVTIYTQKLISTKPDKLIEERIIYIKDEINSIFKRIYDFGNATGYEIKSVYIEGLSMGSKGSKMFELAGLHFFIRIFLSENGYNYKVIPPTTLKKFVTGKGNAQKNLMLLNVYKRWGVDLDNDNICDAYSLSRMALEEDKNNV